MRCVTAIAMTGLLALGPAALADELNTDWLPPGFQWVVHVDAEGFFASEIGKAMVDENGLKLGDIDLSNLEDMGIDVEADLHGVTVYAGAAGRHVGILSFADSVDLKGILNTAQEEHADVHKVVIIDDILLHVWGDKAATFFGTEGDDRFVVFSEDNDRAVADAVKVILGETKSYKDADGDGLKIRPPEGAIVFGAVTCTAALPDMDPASEVIKHAEAFSASITERDGDVEMTTSIVAKSRDQAKDITDVFNGMLALVRLNAEQNEWFGRIAKLTKDVTVERDRRRITVTLRADGEMVRHLIGMLEEH
jgi:hypothetical protein